MFSKHLISLKLVKILKVHKPNLTMYKNWTVQIFYQFAKTTIEEWFITYTKSKVQYSEVKLSSIRWKVQIHEEKVKKKQCAWKYEHQNEFLSHNSFINSPRKLFFSLI